MKNKSRDEPERWDIGNHYIYPRSTPLKGHVVKSKAVTGHVVKATPSAELSR